MATQRFWAMLAKKTGLTLQDSYAPVMLPSKLNMQYCRYVLLDAESQNRVYTLPMQGEALTTFPHVRRASQTQPTPPEALDMCAPVLDILDFLLHLNRINIGA